MWRPSLLTNTLYFPFYIIMYASSGAVLNTVPEMGGAATTVLGVTGFFGLAAMLLNAYWMDMDGLRLATKLTTGGFLWGIGFGVFLLIARSSAASGGADIPVYSSGMYPGLKSMLSGLLVATVIIVSVFTVRWKFGVGGHGDSTDRSPEEQVLGDDLNL